MRAPTSDDHRNTEAIDWARRIGLQPQHVQYFQDRAVPLQLLAETPIRSVTGEDAARLLGRSSPVGCPCLAIYYDTSTQYVRIRLDDPSVAEGARYLGPKDKPVPIYVPPRFELGAGGPIVVVESAVKALSLVAAGLCAVGLGGTPTTLRKKAAFPRLNDSWDRLGVADQHVVILFDANRNWNASVARDEARLAMALESAGATVSIGRIPLPANGEDIGPDDYHAANGPEALLQVIAEAVPSNPLKRLEREHDPLALLGDLPFRISVLQRGVECAARVKHALAARKVGAAEWNEALREAKQQARDSQRTPEQSHAGSESAEADGALFEMAEPWPELVDGAALLHEIATTIQRFVVLPRGAYTAMSLWILHTYVVDAARITPRLAFVSPAKRCGKTKALDLLNALVSRALPTANISPAALFRSVEKHRPTLLVDEADTFLLGKPELEGILNAGHARGGRVLRCVGDEHEPRPFKVFSPVAIASIGGLNDTLMDRSIVVEMRRKAPAEQTARFRSNEWETLSHLRQKSQRWADDHRKLLSDATPPLPEGLDDRAQDNWEALFAIADAAGGPWPEQGRRAASVLSQQRTRPDESQGLGEELLADVRDLFAESGADRFSSLNLCDMLAALAGRPWEEASRGRPITQNRLAKLLRPFGIRPRTIRLPDGTTPKGYVLDDFQDAFARYLEPAAATAATPSEPLANRPPAEPQQLPLVAPAPTTETPSGYGHVAPVAAVAPHQPVPQTNPATAGPPPPPQGYPSVPAPPSTARSPWTGSPPSASSPWVGQTPAGGTVTAAAPRPAPSAPPPVPPPVVAPPPQPQLSQAASDQPDSSVSVEHAAPVPPTGGHAPPPPVPGTAPPPPVDGEVSALLNGLPEGPPPLPPRVLEDDEDYDDEHG